MKKMETKVAKIENYQIVINHDSDCDNPYENWDGCVPTMYEYEGRITDFSKGAILDYIRSVYSDNVIIRNQKKIAEIFELDLTGLTPDEKFYEIDNALCSPSIEQLAQLCEFKKIPYLSWGSYGYSQGDYLDVLSVITPEFIKDTGIDAKKSKENLDSNKELFDSAIWGDVFGFTVYYFENGKYNEDGDLRDYWEADLIDSCGGFYGYDYKTNGMTEHINIELTEQEILTLLEEGFDNIKY